MILSELSDNEKLRVAISLLKESIDNGRYFLGTIMSDSMLPLLKTRDQVLIGKCHPENLRLGDLIVYKTSECLCCHRYMYSQDHLNTRIMITKADSCPQFDVDIIPYDQLIGKVLSIEKPQSKIELTSMFWKIMGYFIGTLSLTEGSINKTFSMLDNDNKKRQNLSVLQKVFAFPFSKALHYIILLSLR